MCAVYVHTVSAVLGGTLCCQILGYRILSSRAESEERPDDRVQLFSAQMTEAVRWRGFFCGVGAL